MTLRYYFDSNGYLVVKHAQAIDIKAAQYDANEHKLPEGYNAETYDFQNLARFHDAAETSSNLSFSAAYLAIETYLTNMIAQQVEEEAARNPKPHPCAITTSALRG